MKTLNSYMSGLFKNIGAEIIQVNTKRELKDLIEKTIKEKGLNCDLNFIDTSKITDMSELFYWSEFNGDISCWNVCWNVSNVENMYDMFTRSQFNGDISKWNVSKARCMQNMFDNSKLKKLNKLPGWYK